ncbi:MAG TPA: hypothetical protein VMY37_26085 [Thermoguttaceae bacterium]|nr:hypothetical protein [Thermoguttaceae bacterium]
MLSSGLIAPALLDKPAVAPGELWTRPLFGYATLLKAGDKLLILKTDGVLVLAAANVDRYEELARTRIADATTRALPALAAGRLYVRDTRTLTCLDVGAEVP